MNIEHLKMIKRKSLAFLFFFIPTVLLIGLFSGGAYAHNYVDRWLDGIKRLDDFLIPSCLALFLTVMAYEAQFLSRICLKNFFLSLFFHLTVMIIFAVFGTLLDILFQVVGHQLKIGQVIPSFEYLFLGGFILCIWLVPFWYLLGISWSVICQKLNMNIIQNRITI